MTEKTTLRKAVHNLLNRDGLVILLLELAREDLRMRLKKETFKPSVQEILQNLLKDLDNIAKEANTTDSLIKQIRAFVYTKLDPDQNELEITTDEDKDEDEEVWR